MIKCTLFGITLLQSGMSLILTTSFQEFLLCSIFLENAIAKVREADPRIWVSGNLVINIREVNLQHTFFARVEHWLFTMASLLRTIFFFSKQKFIKRVKFGTKI